MAEYQSIPKEKFEFADKGDVSHDKVLLTKPRSYWRDAFSRFCKNKGSVVGACVIILLVLFAIIGPFCTAYTPSYSDLNFGGALPRNEWFASGGIDFWDGCQNTSQSEQTFILYYSMGAETGHYAVKNQEYTVDKSSGTTLYRFRLDTYHKNGCLYRNVDEETYRLIQQYQNETGIQVIYPTTSYSSRQANIAPQDLTNANYWFLTRISAGKTVAVLSDSSDPTSLIPNYNYHAKGSAGDVDLNYNSLRIEGEDGIEINGETCYYDYARRVTDGYEIRVNYYEYYTFRHSYLLKDGISNPSFLFGATADGKDIFSCLSSGARFSFVFAIIVACVNIIVGAIYGAIEGYYGGKLDLTMERIAEILSAVPSVIVITLLREYLHASGFIILFIAFFLTGWIGMAGRTRMQFYRFKNQEYVLAARTLGAKDRRLMWKHIFPNAIGTLVTSCALVIPSMIFSEVSFTYLGIINLDSGNLTSVGTLISKGQTCLMAYPHVAIFPSVFLILLMLSFNLFGNGLRDAFNPQLRGSEG